MGAQAAEATPLLGCGLLPGRSDFQGIETVN